jgi:hypothetical protein
MAHRSKTMTSVEATAEVFWTALKALSRKEQQAVLRRVVQDEKLRHDLIDLAVIEERRQEPARPLREYLARPRE